MTNNNCINDILLYLDEHMVRRRNGNCIGVYVRNMADELEYDRFDIFDAVQYLLEHKIITQTNPENKKSIGATKINGFTSKGKELLNALKDDKLSNKVPALLDKIIPLLSTGKTILECIALFI